MAVFAEHMILGVKAAVRVLIDDVPDGVERTMAEELLHDQEESRRKVEGALGFAEDVSGEKGSVCVCARVCVCTCTCVCVVNERGRVKSVGRQVDLEMLKLFLWRLPFPFPFPSGPAIRDMCHR